MLQENVMKLFCHSKKYIVEGWLKTEPRNKYTKNFRNFQNFLFWNSYKIGKNVCNYQRPNLRIHECEIFEGQSSYSTCDRFSDPHAIHFYHDHSVYILKEAQSKITVLFCLKIFNISFLEKYRTRDNNFVRRNLENTGYNQNKLT